MTDVWSGEVYAGDPYEVVKEFSLKRELDKEIVNEVCDHTEDLENATLIEFGCGRGPISQSSLEGNYVKEAIGIDLNTDMLGYEEYHGTKFLKGDISSLDGLQSDLKEKADIAILENAWYAVTVPSKGDRRLTEEEALWMRENALKNIAYTLKEGGKLIITDPLASARDLGVGGVLGFLGSELKATMQERNDRNVIAGLKELISTISNPVSKKVLKINQEITRNAHLFETMEEVISFIESTNLFEVEKSEGNKYLGHNVTLILKRTSLKVEKFQDQKNLEQAPKIKNSYVVGTDHPFIGRLIGTYRRIGYTIGKVNPAVPVSDKWDKSRNGCVVVITGYQSPTPLAVCSLFIPDKELGLEMSEIMKPSEGSGESFEKNIERKVVSLSDSIRGVLNSGNEMKMGELRRFSSAIAGKNLPQQEFGKFIVSIMPMLATELKEYAKENNLSIGLFISDEQRMRLFNHGLKNTGIQFSELPGFELDREDPMKQTLFISGADYFFHRVDDKLDLKESELLTKIREEISKLDGEDKNWMEIIENSALIEDKRAAFALVDKILKEIPDGVRVYYTDLTKI